MIVGYSADALIISGGTIQLRPDYNPFEHRVEFQITDDDTWFDGDTPNDEIGYDTNQTADVVDMLGNTIASGQIYDEEFHAISDASGFHGWIDVLEIGGIGVGYITDAPLQPGVVYTITATQDVDAATALEYSDFTNVACFTAGTLISTTDGDLPVEWLAIGDQVITRDYGAQSLRWIGRARVPWRRLTTNSALWPVKLTPELLGGRNGATPLIVSPLHRVLLTGARIEYLFGEREVLANAAHLEEPRLSNAPGGPMTYYHLLFDRHEIILANGLWTESLFADCQQEGIRPPAEIRHQETARPCLKRWEAELWLGRFAAAKRFERHCQHKAA